MKTLPLHPQLLALVRDYGHNKAVAWLEGEEELAIADDDLTSFLSRHDVEFDQLTESDRDVLRDEYLEAVKSTMSSRYTPPVSTQIDSGASLQSGGSDPLFKAPMAREAFKEWWKGYCLDPCYPYSAEEKEDHMAEAFVGGFLFAKESAASPPSPEKPVVQPTESDSARLLEECRKALVDAMEAERAVKDYDWDPSYWGATWAHIQSVLNKLNA